jgi:hypothetical protein
MMRKRNRKGYVHTLEAFLAFFMTFIFVVFIVLKGVSPKPVKDDLDVLKSLEQRDDFRECVFANNVSCVENITDPFIPASYNYKISINAPEPFKGSKDIYTETVFITSNQTGDYKVVYLYYWVLSG